MRQRLKRVIAREPTPDPSAKMTDDEISLAFELEISRMVDGVADMNRTQRERRAGSIAATE